ncbi:ATP synthase F1 subunit delta [bacterium]|nr:MAG: ATP synthase F1 subunit delta [bacterium]
MKFTVKQYAQALHEAISDTNPKDHDKVINNFIEALKQNGDLASYENVVNEFESMVQDANQTTKIEVTTASEAAATPGLIKELNTFAKSKGQKAEITTKVNEEIIGGVLIKVDDTLIDASLKSQLENLEQELKN